MNTLLRAAADRAQNYLDQLPTRPVAPASDALAGLAEFDEPLPAAPTEPEEVIALLDELGSPATLATAGGRFFGFVIGGSLPVAVAANFLAAAWDQNGGLIVSSPINAKLEEVSLRWLTDLLRLPLDVGGGFVTSATAANFAAIVAARHALLRREGWDVESRGLFGAPEISVIVGEEVHVSILKALAMAGLGRDRVTRVPVDDQGRMRVDQMPEIQGPTIVCTQAGHINSGAFDPVGDICDLAHAAGAWVHVDGAFGLWAAATPSRAHLAAGIEKADSWGTDAHKLLNVTYDSGVVFARDRIALRNAMATSAAYLVQDEERIPYQYTPDFSRRARGVEVWAALRHLGRSGVAELIERTCRHARRFAEGLRAAGHNVLNDVVFNQVCVTFGDEQRTRDVIARIQADGTCWCGGASWRGHAVMRISVCSWATTDEDVERSLTAILRAAE